jgi:hypothetical protein
MIRSQFGIRMLPALYKPHNNLESPHQLPIGDRILGTPNEQIHHTSQFRRRRRRICFCYWRLCPISHIGSSHFNPSCRPHETAAATTRPHEAAAATTILHQWHWMLIKSVRAIGFAPAYIHPPFFKVLRVVGLVSYHVDVNKDIRVIWPAPWYRYHGDRRVCLTKRRRGSTPRHHRAGG